MYTVPYQFPGCEYGDLFELCKKDQCINYEEDYSRENCCDTCAELLFTIPSTIATTTIATTTTVAAKPGTGGSSDVDVAGSKGNVTSHGGSGRRVFPPGGEDGGNIDEEDRAGREGDDGDDEGRDDDFDYSGNRRKFYNRRNYIESEDSDDSGEKSTSITVFSSWRQKHDT